MRLHQLVAVPLLLVALVGCGGTAAGDDGGIASAEDSTGSETASPEASSSPTTGQSMDPQERQLKFAQCMRANGIPMEDPDPNGGPVQIKIPRGDAKVQAAMEKCRQYAPFGEGGRSMSPEEQQKMLDFTKCMRENGIDMPDPDPNGGAGIRINPGDGINPDDPKFKAAIEKCRQYMPMRQGGQGGGQ
jgi:hypothetical protein